MQDIQNDWYVDKKATSFCLKGRPWINQVFVKKTHICSSMSQNPLPRGEQAEKPPVEESSLNLLEEKGRQLHVVLMWIIAIYCVVFFFVNLMIDQREQAVISIAGLPAVSITWLLYS
ncbi:MAG: hypothetical protein ACKOKB_04910, partial [Bacteroidota bacterium]